jgi:hypothetical protein
MLTTNYDERGKVGREKIFRLFFRLWLAYSNPVCANFGNKWKRRVYNILWIKNDNKKNVLHARHDHIGYMVLNATFNNISAISWRSVLLVEETGVLGENHRPGKLYHILLHRVHLAMSGILITLVVIGTDCTGSCKSNYYAITTTTAY